jgi:uncharacterized HAD superfamily protein
MQYTIQHNKFMAQNAANAIKKSTKKESKRKSEVTRVREREKTVMMPRSHGIYRVSKNWVLLTQKNETFQCDLKVKV